MFDTGFLSPRINAAIFTACFAVASLGIIAGIARTCPASRPATVFYDAEGVCMYWQYDDERKPNPCGKDERFVPENASPEWPE